MQEVNILTWSVVRMNDILLTGNNKNYNHNVGQASRLSENFYRRHLPHFQLSSGYYYFITFTTYNRKTLQPFEKDYIFDAINYMDTKEYELHAFVILNDHIHIIINPIDKLSRIMHSIKSYTAHEINKKTNRKGKFWQDENYDKIIRSEKEFIEKIKYIVNNPIKANLSKSYTDYKWLYVKGWIDNS